MLPLVFQRYLATVVMLHSHHKYYPRLLTKLIEIAKNSKSGPDDRAPIILILAPPPLGKLTEYADTFTGGPSKSRELAAHYKNIAQEHGCGFFDTGTVIKSSKVDGLHFDPEGHEALGKAVAEAVNKILNP